MIRIFTIAADGNINIQSDVLIYNTERYRIGCSVFIPHNLLCIKEINSLILGCFTAKCNTSSYGWEGFLNVLSQVSAENTRFGRSIIPEFSCFCTKLNNLALIYDNHTLSFVDSDDWSVWYNVIFTLVIACATAFLTLMSLGHQHISV